MGSGEALLQARIKPVTRRMAVERLIRWPQPRNPLVNHHDHCGVAILNGRLGGRQLTWVDRPHFRTHLHRLHVLVTVCVC